jgi:hypothetical protein
VKYDPREFVLHLYARVCERVLHPQGDVDDPSQQTMLERTRKTALGNLASARRVCSASSAR